MAYVVHPQKAKQKNSNPVPKMPVLLYGDDLYLSELEKMEKAGCTFILCHQALNNDDGQIVTQMFPWVEFRGHELYNEMSADRTTKKTKKTPKNQSSSSSSSSASSSSNFVVSAAKSSSSSGKNAKRA